MGKIEKMRQTLCRGTALVTLLASGAACEKGSSGPESGSGGAVGAPGSGGNSAAAPPWLGGNDLSCLEKAKVSTCSWAVSADRIVWGDVVAFELLTSPVFRSSPEFELWERACSSPLDPIGRLTIAVEEDLWGEGEDTVEVTLSSGLLSEFRPAPRLGPGGETVWLPEGSGAGIFPGMKIGLALHRVDGYSDWLALDEELFGLYEGKLATSSVYCTEFPPVLYERSLDKLREALSACEGSDAEKRALPAPAYAFLYAAAHCDDPVGPGGEGGAAP